MQVTIENREPGAAEIHVVPTLWFRNRWPWGRDNPRLKLEAAGDGVVCANEHRLGERFLYCDGAPGLLFTENETNMARVLPGRIRQVGLATLPMSSNRLTAAAFPRSYIP